jgi:hypothetical protein
MSVAQIGAYRACKSLRMRFGYFAWAK